MAQPTRVMPTNIGPLSDVPVYNLLNGDTVTITPFLFRPAIQTFAHWVPIDGMRYEKALECVGAFIRSHIWHVYNHRYNEWSDAHCRKIGFILGVARAVCYANYQISADRLISCETADPVMDVSFGTDNDATPTYHCLVEDPRTEKQRQPPAECQTATPDPRSILIDTLYLSEDERAVLPALVKSALAIIPLQGYLLISKGLNHLSDEDEASFRVFNAVERQHWVGDRVSAYLNDGVVNVRDILWNKACHPVSIAVKQVAATSQLVADKLREAGVESASCRLPAVESEVKEIRSYLMVTDAVRSSIETYGGVVDNSLFHEVSLALTHFPLCFLPDYREPEPIVLGAKENNDGTRAGGVRVSNRQEVICFAKDLISRSKSKVAVCYGYYEAMLDAGLSAATGGEARDETLLTALSLRRLKRNCMASYHAGMQYYKDLQSKGRKEGNVEDLLKIP